MEASMFGKYEQVLSGHFHHKSARDNILYTGVPYQMTWADWNDPKGFHVLDTETRELEFIRNPHEIYVKIGYNDDDLYFDEVQNNDYSAFTGKYVKVIVEKKSNSFLFETLIECLTKANPHDVTIVEDFSDASILDEGEAIDQADDTLSIIDKVVEGMEVELDKPKLKGVLRGIYNDALALES
jgi:DNA repair exonuclease SbcCD nuclease subunit